MVRHLGRFADESIVALSFLPVPHAVSGSIANRGGIQRLAVPGAGAAQLSLHAAAIAVPAIAAGALETGSADAACSQFGQALVALAVTVHVVGVAEKAFQAWVGLPAQIQAALPASARVRRTFGRDLLIGEAVAVVVDAVASLDSYRVNGSVARSTVGFVRRPIVVIVRVARVPDAIDVAVFLARVGSEGAIVRLVCEAVVVIISVASIAQLVTVGDHCYQGECTTGSQLTCDDDNPCTTDSCDPASGCVFSINDLPCDDGDACTFSDACLDGVCLGDPVTCVDNTLCTADECDPGLGCVFPPLSGPCDDNDPCTEGDYCDQGVCQPGQNPQCLAMQRVVLAGDSWSAGLIFPLRDALDDRGCEEVVVSWELTTKPGTKVSDWVSDPNLMASLYLALDAQPPADMLIFTLTGNDFLAAGKGGLGLVGPLEWFLIMTSIQLDLQTFVALARAGRPNLKIALVGYDYLHLGIVEALGNAFPGFDQIKFNLGLIDLSSRGRDVAGATPNMVYAHNIGILQHTFGDYFHPPFLCPNPVAGCPEYGPGSAPKPGPAPGYDPFPGGWYTYPSPLDYIPDGIHPNYDGFRAIIENSLDQGPAVWIEGNPWP